MVCLVYFNVICNNEMHILNKSSLMVTFIRNNYTLFAEIFIYLIIHFSNFCVVLILQEPHHNEI